jgi:hypothetical protein
MNRTIIRFRNGMATFLLVFVAGYCGAILALQKAAPASPTQSHPTPVLVDDPTPCHKC